MKVTPLARAFGLRVEGVDVRNLSDSERGEIIRAGNAAGVVHIPEQSLSEAEQLEFTRLYGRVRVLRVNRARNSQRPPGIVEISNVDADGNIVPPGNDMIRFSKGNMMWHSDYSYTADWAAQSILHALEAASEGG
ncbi:MAG: TauD/TfdA family dioxygenase [Boseongicola sp. SB0673_bin_14]|nr:TauD/TfdA family dioxygenase [Boseongicola sp. SB0673_bin_14]